MSNVVMEKQAGAALPWGDWIRRSIALGYFALLLVLPVLMVFWQAFSKGWGAFVGALLEPAAVNAFWLTIVTSVVAVVINTFFGVLIAWVLVRQKFPGKALLNSLIDLPFAVSPVVAGLMLILLYGQDSWIGSFLEANGIKVIFALPSMILATVFVTMPFVVREVQPVLEELGEDQEIAARTLGASEWQVFWRITIPSIRWGLIYGVVLTTARALGEFGAVIVVSGNLIGQTQTLTLHVEERFQSFDLQGAFAGSVLLASLALATLIILELVKLNKQKETIPQKQEK